MFRALVAFTLASSSLVTSALAEPGDLRPRTAVRAIQERYRAPSARQLVSIVKRHLEKGDHAVRLGSGRQVRVASVAESVAVRAIQWSPGWRVAQVRVRLRVRGEGVAAGVVEVSMTTGQVLRQRLTIRS